MREDRGRFAYSYFGLDGSARGAKVTGQEVAGPACPIHPASPRFPSAPPARRRASVCATCWPRRC
ncbi:protein of unknown function [Azospirillum baldaniorum]|uniref:Uncharacterized protein n=1 Tax=Azospirillum baldaniorum TaxID=1064539 RepID=A0A9P1JRG7_9PROT|nr:protein of unknown function [Azospirillum baldaniorum]